MDKFPSSKSPAERADLWLQMSYLRNTYSKLTSLALVHIHAWTCDSVKVKIQFHLECKPLFLCAQLLLQQIVHLMNVHYLKVSTLNKCEYRLRKLPLELVILWSNHWFKIKVTARQEKKHTVFPVYSSIDIFNIGGGDGRRVKSRFTMGRVEIRGKNNCWGV